MHHSRLSHTTAAFFLTIHVTINHEHVVQLQKKKKCIKPFLFLRDFSVKKQLGSIYRSNGVVIINKYVKRNKTDFCLVEVSGRV